MRVGSYTVSNMEYNRMDRCRRIAHSDPETIHFKRSLLRPEQANVRFLVEHRQINIGSCVVLDVPRTVFIDLEPTVIGEDGRSSAMSGAFVPFE